MGSILSRNEPSDTPGTIQSWLDGRLLGSANFRVITIREGYGAYVAPKWVRPTVDRLLSSLDSSHVTGLSGIVLTDAVQSTNGGQGNRSQRQVTLGKYYRRRNGEPAWIELTVDEILKEFRAPFHKLQYSRDLVIARVLYHELGHHLHATRRGIGRAPESSAEAWQTRLSRIHFSHRYGYLKPVLPLLRLVRRMLRAFIRRRRHQGT